MNYLKEVFGQLCCKQTNKQTDKQTTETAISSYVQTHSIIRERMHAIQMDIAKQCNLKMLPFNFLRIPDKGRSYLAIEITICCW